MSYLDALRAQLAKDEAVRLFPYDDATGKRIVPGSIIQGNVTIGIGRNLSGVGISPAESLMLNEHDIEAAELAARELLGNFDALSDVRKCVVVNMAFNLGQEKLEEFHRTLQAIRDCRFGDAATDMLESRWALQVGERAARLADAMRNDKWTT